MPALIPTLNPLQLRDDDLAWALSQGIAAVRINLGRNDLAVNLALAARVQRIARAAGASPEMLFDLPGPKARLGALACAVELRPGQSLALGRGGLPVTTAWLFEQVAIGDELAIGRRGARARIAGTAADRIDLVGIATGAVRSGDSVFIEGRLAQFEDGLTPDDLRLMRGLMAATTAPERGARIGRAVIAPSFVESARTIDRLRQIARELGAAPPPIIAKIETRVGVGQAEAIAAVADGLMIGRDDLSRELAMDRIDGCVLRWAAELGERKRIVAASSYFADLAASDRLSSAASAVLRQLAASRLDAVVSDETAFLSAFRTIVTTGFEHGLR